MIKRSIVLAAFVIQTIGFSQHNAQIDSTAISLLDKMTAVLGELTSISVQVQSTNDQLNELQENERFYTTHELLFSGPNRMTIHSRGDNGDKASW